jgi:hydroxymethylbilane synthase
MMASELATRAKQSASRGSDLALWQTRAVLAEIKRHSTPTSRLWSNEVRVIRTRGDVDMTPILAGQIEKGFFTVELEDALRAGEVDLVVHSLKDLPTADAPRLTTRTVLARANAADLLICNPNNVLHSGTDGLPLAPGTRVGASSLRRMALLQHYAPQTVATPLRGNVPTRVQRLAEGRVDAIVIAAAGIDRLQLDLRDFAAFELDPRYWIPAPGQGALAAQCRRDDHDTLAELERLTQPSCAAATQWERDFLRVIEGGCSTPFGCYVLGDTAYIGEQRSAGFCRQAVALPDSQEDYVREQFIRAVVGSHSRLAPAARSFTPVAFAR